MVEDRARVIGECKQCGSPVTNLSDDSTSRTHALGECPVRQRPVVKGPVDGNAFAVMGAVVRALRRAGQADKVAEYREKAMSGDYNHLLAVSMKYVDFDL